MREREMDGRKSIEQTRQVRARPAKLEPVSHTAARHIDADRDLDKAWSEWERTFDAIQDSIMLLDGESNIVQANAATSRLFGRPLDEIIGQTCYELVHGTSDPPESCVLRKAKSTKKRQEAELHIAEKNMWAAVSVDPILDEQGNMTDAVYIIRDITERRRAEKALNKERDMAQKYLDVAGVIMVALDSDGRVRLMNRKGCEILGYTESEIIGKNWFDSFLPESEPDRVKAVFRKLMAGEIEPVEYFENPILTKDGSERLIAWHNTVIRNETGDITAILSSGADITERKKAERALEESEEKYRSLVANIPDVIWTTDHKGITTFISSNIEKVYGYTPQEIYEQGEKLRFGRIHPNDVDGVKRAFGDVFYKGKQLDIEYRIKRKDGQWIWLHDRSIGAYEKDGLRYANGVFFDITERKKAERELLAKQAELKALTSELSLAEERERRRIAAGIHDDIGQKLALAKLELQMFMSSADDSKTPTPSGPAPKGHASLDGVCATIDKAIEDCHSLTFELSNPALYELGFEAAIEQWLYEQVQKKHGIECEVAVNGDAVQPAEELKITLFRAIRELGANVVKHAKASALRVSIERVGDNVQVTLADNGTGFVVGPAGAALSMDKTGGFGLFNIKERLEHLGGNLKIESTPGRGTTITLTAPLEHQGNKQRKGAEK